MPFGVLGRTSTKAFPKTFNLWIKPKLKSIFNPILDFLNFETCSKAILQLYHFKLWPFFLLSSSLFGASTSEKLWLNFKKTLFLWFVKCVLCLHHGIFQLATLLYFQQCYLKSSELLYCWIHCHIIFSHSKTFNRSIATHHLSQTLDYMVGGFDFVDILITFRICLHF